MILKTLKFTEEYGRGFEREHEVCVSADNDIKDGEKVYVTLYTITRHFGGPEEGGWWYNWTAQEWSVPTLYSKENVNEIVARYRSQIEEMVGGDIYSVNGGQDASIRVEREAGQDQSKERPYYC